MRLVVLERPIRFAAWSVYVIVLFFAYVGLAVLKGFGDQLPNWAYTAGILGLIAASILVLCRLAYDGFRHEEPLESDSIEAAESSDLNKR